MRKVRKQTVQGWTLERFHEQEQFTKHAGGVTLFVLVISPDAEMAEVGYLSQTMDYPTYILRLPIMGDTNRMLRSVDEITSRGAPERMLERYAEATNRLREL